MKKNNPSPRNPTWRMGSQDGRIRGDRIPPSQFIRQKKAIWGPGSHKPSFRGRKLRWNSNWFNYLSDYLAKLYIKFHQPRCPWNSRGPISRNLNATFWGISVVWGRYNLTRPIIHWHPHDMVEIVFKKVSLLSSSIIGLDYSWYYRIISFTHIGYIDIGQQK